MAPTIPDEAPRPPLQDAQVRTPIAYQVHDAAAQAVEALRAPAQTAASTTSGFWSNFWGLQGSQRLPSNATPPGSAAIGVQGDSTSFDPDPRSRAENPGLGQIKASGYDFQPAPPRQEVSTAPFFHDVPDRALSGILPSDDVDSKALWKALEEGMPYLNRRRRKAYCIEHPIGLFICLRALVHTKLSNDWSRRIRLLLSLTFAAQGAKIFTMIHFGGFLLGFKVGASCRGDRWSTITHMVRERAPRRWTTSTVDHPLRSSTNRSASALSPLTSVISLIVIQVCVLA